MTNKALTVSIVIPVYNEEGYLEACLEAVARQTIKPLQVIVVNNNSTDKTVAIAKKYRFVELSQAKPQGVTYARDLGFDNVQADIIGRIDADTVLPPNWLQTVIDIFTNDARLDAISGPTGFYDLPGRGFSLWATKLIRTSLFYAGRRDSRYLFGSNMAVRRNAWQAVAGQVCHQSGLHEDNDLAIHLDRQGFEVGYTNKLVADISVRRTDTKPRDSFKYAFSEYRTYRHHGIISLRAAVAGLILLAIYPGLKIMHRAYNPVTGRLSLKTYRTSKLVARPHPQI
ncbi:MAG: glycosyltransferase family 2 protein [Candidatus Saccharimonadales bacterium]